MTLLNSRQFPVAHAFGEAVAEYFEKELLAKGNNLTAGDYVMALHTALRAMEIPSSKNLPVSKLDGGES